jgi:hypothetical protein
MRRTLRRCLSAIFSKGCLRPPGSTQRRGRRLIRRECVDHIVVWGEGHLRRTLRAYACYYNGIRTHRSLDKDAPAFRSVQRVGTITPYAILGGLHHHYGGRNDA